MQGYNQKPIPPECRNCKHFTSEFKKQEWGYYEGYYEVERNFRCVIGGFAVKKTANCKKHEFKTNK